LNVRVILAVYHNNLMAINYTLPRYVS